MKKIIAAFLAIIMVFTMFMASAADITSNEVQVDAPEATTTDLDEYIYDDEDDISDTTEEYYCVMLDNLSRFNIVALNNATLNGHVRGSIWVGGTLHGGEWKFVDDGSLDHTGAGTSYIYNNESAIQFKSRTDAQSTEAYLGLTEEAVNVTSAYWRELIDGAGSNEQWIYLAPNEEGHVDLQVWDYQCPGSDESQSTIEKIYWTDATSVTMGGLAGHLIAPYATVVIVNCNHCGSIVAENIITSGESHINYWNPPGPPDKPTPTPTETPTPTPITVTKKLKGEIWQVRCDIMDNTTFTAGGGYWYADISNWENKTSKEGHRSNHCGNWENWVLFVDENGTAVSLYQLKSGSTGGTLPSIMYRAPSDLAHLGEGQLKYDPTDPNDEMTARLINEVFIPSNVMPFKDIHLEEGERLFWISQNKNQVWHHTGILRKTEPKFTIVINGTPYLLGVDESITIDDLEEGLVEIEEIATANYKLQEIQYDEDGNIVVINEIDPPNKPTPTPPPPVVTPTPTPTPTPEETDTPTPTPDETETPTPTPTPTPEDTETPTPTPEDTETPTPTPDEPTPTPCGFTIKKIVTNPQDMEETIFFFKVTGIGLEEPLYVEVPVSAENGYGEYYVEVEKPGKYTVEEIDIPIEYELKSDKEVTLYVVDGHDIVFEFENYLIPPTTVTPSEVPSDTPTPTPTP